MQKQINIYRKKIDRAATSAATTGWTFFLLAACGNGSDSSEGDKNVGFPSSYVPPKPNYDAPVSRDPYAGLLSAPYVEPYWVQALQMDQYDVHIPSMLTHFHRTIEYTFPTAKPSYDLQDVAGWQPATDRIKLATREILLKFEEILDVSFVEVSETNATNVISISSSTQVGTSGFSYFPNNHFEIGMDVFISHKFAEPRFISNLNTNYDYEVLVHELGHALGLKHPFEAHGVNTTVLTSYEDNTLNTSMSYNEIFRSFDGTMRPLDWMTLTKFYGVKSTYNAGNDTYSFSSTGATFIIDGAGIDTISLTDTSIAATVDLRPGSQSHLESKSNHITDPGQLTISHGTNIENVETGSGNDTVVGNSLDNKITTGGGDDTIYAGDGSDTIKSGSGRDIVDLSETSQERDTIIFDLNSSAPNFDTIYGFVQGIAGDVFEVSSFVDPVVELFPLIVSENVPIANISGGILRIIGDNLLTHADVANAFKIGGEVESLAISNNATALIIAASDQDTGSDQSIFHATGGETGITINHIALLQGNALDIDQWHLDNFSFV